MQKGWRLVDIYRHCLTGVSHSFIKVIQPAVRARGITTQLQIQVYVSKKEGLQLTSNWTVTFLLL